MQEDATMMSAGGLKKGCLLLWDAHNEHFIKDSFPILCHPLLTTERMSYAINQYIDTIQDDNDEILHRFYHDYKNGSVQDGKELVLKCENSLKLSHGSDQGIPPYTIVACKSYYKNVTRNKHR